MVGREVERAQIEQLLDRAAHGAVGISLEGPPGIGKTALWREAVQAARARGYRVLRTAPAEPDAHLAFAGLGDLFDAAVNDVAAGLPDPQRRAFTAALLLEEASEGPANPQALPRAVLTAIRGLAAKGPVVVAIDDEQWLDRASARVLAFALGRLRDEPVCVVLARRTNGDGALWPELAKGFGGAGLKALEIAPLDLRTTDFMLRSQLKRTIPRRVVGRVHAVSGGNPLYALMIARELPADHVAAGEITIPKTLADAMHERLRRLDQKARDPLLVVAACSAPTLTLLQAVLPDVALSDLDSAVRAGVIEIDRERVSFTHPLLASTHYSSASPPRRRELHRTLATVLDDEEERARHIALGAEAPDAEVALTLEQAAGGAARRGAPETAAELFEHAARLTPIDDVETRSSRWISAAELHAASGDIARQRHLLERLLPEMPRGSTRARALLQLAMTCTDDLNAANDTLDEAIGEATEDYRVLAQIESLYSDLMSHCGKFREMVAHATSAVSHAKRAEDPGLLAQAVAAEAIAAFFTGQRVNLHELEAAIELEDFAHATTYELPSAALGRVLCWSDDFDRARPALERAFQRATRLGEDLDATTMLGFLATLEWYSGNHDQARQKLAVCQEAVRDQGYLALDVSSLWSQSLFSAGRGDLMQARATAQQALAATMHNANVLSGIQPTIVLAQLDLWSGQAEAVHEQLQPLRESFLAAGFGFVGSLSLGMWTLDIEALIALDRLDQAEAVLDDLSKRARRAKNPHAQALAHRCGGLLLASRGEIPEAIDDMDAALADHARRPLQPEIARTLVEKGALERRAKRKSAAKHTLEQALGILEPLDAAILHARARDELSRIGLRPPSVTEGLTPAQTRVAELVVAGMSNREIANTLFMSTRSVESHLTKVYRELAVRSRAQLVAIMTSNSKYLSAKAGGPNGEGISQVLGETTGDRIESTPVRH